MRAEIVDAIRSGAAVLVGVAAAPPPPEACDAVGTVATDVWLFVVSAADPDWAGDRFDAIAERLQPRRGTLPIGCAELRAAEDVDEVIDRALANYARASAARVIDPETGRWAQPAAPGPPTRD